MEDCFKLPNAGAVIAGCCMGTAVLGRFPMHVSPLNHIFPLKGVTAVSVSYDQFSS